MYKTERYKDAKDIVPYTNWIKKLRKKKPQEAVRIDARVARGQTGTFGDHKFERDGVWALRLDFGPGYRVYYSLEDQKMILLLSGGDKTTQDTDIDNAVAYLADYHKRKKP